MVETILTSSRPVTGRPTSHTDTSLSHNSPPPAAAAAAPAVVVVVVVTVRVNVSSSTSSARRTSTKPGGGDDNIPVCKCGLFSILMLMLMFSLLLSLLLFVVYPFLPDLDNVGFAKTVLRAGTAAFTTFDGALTSDALSPATEEPKSPTRAEAGRVAPSLFDKSFAFEASRWPPVTKEENYVTVVV